MRGLFVLLILGLSAGSISGTWPDCVESGVDYSGFDKKWVSAFSPDGCAKWCRETSGCARWIFYEGGSKCHLKIADDPAARREKADPLTDADRLEFPNNDTSPEKAARVALRIAELSQTHTGPASCFPTVISIKDISCLFGVL